jgi:hypothetical protein
MCLVLHQKCEKSAAKDKSLPLNSYLVTYISEEETFYDIVICNKQVDIFDMYWDKYREGLQNIRWTDGRVNPKLWQAKTEKTKK